MKQILIVAGIHGDEIGAVLTARELKGWVEGKNIENVKVIPEVNKKGIEENNRLNPIDNKDLNRIFPGDKNGTDSEVITNELFDLAKGFDYIIDIHIYKGKSR